jgi:DNA-directed RNA polymerase specialized sigma subunit
MAMFSEACLKAVGTTNKDKIRYLRRFSIIDKEINRKIEELSYWRSRLGQITSIATAVPKGGGSIYKSGDIIAKIVDLEEEINRDIDRLVELKKEIEDTIEQIEDEQLRLLLRYRYIDGKVWEQIAVDMGYGWRHIHRLHSKALDELKMA